MATTTVGSGQFTYEVDKQWGRRDGGVAAFGVVSGTACDSSDRVYVFNRLPTACVMVFDRDGTFLTQWGEGQFKHPHGIWISPADELYLTDRDTHLVTKWTTDGKLLQSWGAPDQPGAPGMPFNEPTNVFVATDGEMFVSDGYGQHRVHRFGANGQLKNSWGEKGTEPGQFGWPVHNVWEDQRGRVMVCDRENGRIQHFDREGNYQGEWSDLKAPQQVYERGDVLYLCEGGQRISVRTLDFAVLAEWGSKGPGPDQFTDSPHSIWADSRGDIYVGEVVAENKLQKYVRR
jgi:sugar lactone lactonase YvrE